MATSAAHDLFVSYAAPDRAWVEGYLLDALTAAGVRVHSEETFELGRPRLLDFEDAVRQSHRTLLVISAAYLADEAAGFIDLLAQTYGLESGTWPVIPLLIEPVALPPRLAALNRLDATDPEAWGKAVARLVADLDRPLPAAVTPSCPYPGMRPFSEANAPDFHGREAETEELLQRLRAQHDRAHRFLAVIGPSGSGKSSLVFAGLVPALRQSRLFGADEWTVLSLRPGPAPMDSPTRVLSADAPVDGPTLTELLAAPPAGLLLVIIDQFEELFTLTRAEQVAPVQQALAQLASRPDCFVVLTARADFYTDLMALTFWPLIAPNRAEVLPLDEAGLRQAIVRPAERSGVYIEAALVERVVDDAAGEPGVLPLVQETLVLLWEHLERRYLPLRAYEALVLPRTAYGERNQEALTGLQVAVARHADATLAELDEPQQAIARRVFLGLVQQNEGRADTRRQRPYDDLRAVGDDPARFDRTIDHLAANRLLTLSGAENAGARRVDLAHEALIAGWPWLRQLVVAHRDASQTKDRLDAKVADWERLGRGEGGLLDAVELAEAEQWLTSPDAAVLGTGIGLPALVAASRAELEREVRRLRVRLYGAVVFAAAAVIAAVIAAYFFNSAQKGEKLANAERDRAERQAEINLAQALAAQAPRQHEFGEDERGALLARQAYLLYRASDGPLLDQVDEALRQSLGIQNFSQILQSHAGPITSIAVNPQTPMLAAAGYDGVVQIWRLDHLGAPATQFMTVDTEPATSVAFSPDGERLAAGSRDGTVRVWEEFGSNSAPDMLANVGNPISSVVFSRNGDRLFVGGEDGVVRVWDLNGSGMEPAVLGNHQEPISAMAINPKEDVLASSGSGSIHLWTLNQGAPTPIALHGQTSGITSLAFSPDGSTLASGGENGEILLWNIHHPDTAPFLRGSHEGSVASVVFNRGGTSLASAATHGNVLLWGFEQLSAPPTSITSGSSSGTMLSATALAFDSHEDTLIVAGFAEQAGDTVGAVRLFHLTGPATDPVSAVGNVGRVTSVVIAPDGTILAGGSTAGAGTGGVGTVRLWSAGQLNAFPNVLTGGEVLVTSIAVSGDGTWLAAGGYDGEPGNTHGTVRLWNLHDREAGETLLETPYREILSVALSADGRYVAAGVASGEVLLWDREQSSNFTVLSEQPWPVASVTLSVDGKMLAAASRVGAALNTENHILLWNLDDPQNSPIVMGESGGEITSIAFNPEGSVFAAGLLNGRVQLWDTAHPDTPIAAFDAGFNALASIVFSPDGRYLAAGGNSAVWIWDAHDGASPVILAVPVDGISAVTYTPDGQAIVVGSVSGVHLLGTTDGLAAMVCATVHRNLSLNEWHRFVGEGIPYQQTCPDLPPGEGVPDDSTPGAASATQPPGVGQGRHGDVPVQTGTATLVAMWLPNAASRRGAARVRNAGQRISHVARSGFA